MGLFSRWLGRRDVPGERDMVQFTDGLNKGDPDDVGLVVAQATDVRHHFRKEWGVDLAYPAAASLMLPGLGARLLEEVHSLQRKGDMFSLSRAAGVMVWLHSVRALNNLDLRPRGREMWSALSRGFPDVEEATDRYSILTGHDLDLTDFDRVADGLGPPR